MPNIVAFAPMPSANASSTVIVNPGARRSCRIAYDRSSESSRIDGHGTSPARIADGDDDSPRENRGERPQDLAREPGARGALAAARDLARELVAQLVEKSVERRRRSGEPKERFRPSRHSVGFAHGRCPRQGSRASCAATPPIRECACAGGCEVCAPPRPAALARLGREDGETNESLVGEAAERGVAGADRHAPAGASLNLVANREAQRLAAEMLDGQEREELELSEVACDQPLILSSSEYISQVGGRRATDAGHLRC